MSVINSEHYIDYNKKAKETIEKLCEQLIESQQLNQTLRLEIINPINGMQRIKYKKSYEKLFAVIYIIYDLLLEDNYISLRDVYYSLKHIFYDQSECNAVITEIGSILMLTRYQMHIIPASKGYVFGSISFQFEESNDHVQDFIIKYDSNSLNEFIYMNEPQLISSKWSRIAHKLHTNNLDNIKLIIYVPDNIKFLLVIEKEGVFTRLCDEKFYERVPCILVCGCGCPDISTRALVSVISQIYTGLYIIALGDYNPYGVGILLSYKCQSVSSGYEGIGVNTPSMKWLGLRTLHIEEIITSYEQHNLQFQPFTVFDESKCRTLIQNLESKPSDLSNQAYIKEIKAMATKQYKLELESLYFVDNHYLTLFLERSILSNDFI